MCLDRDKVMRKEKRTNAETCNASGNSCKINNVYLITLIVKVKGQNHKRKISAVLDKWFSELIFEQ